MLGLAALAAGAACSGDNGSAPAVATSIAITPAALSLTDCEQAPVQVAAYDDKGRPVVGVVISLASTNSAVVQVNGAGLLTAHGAGNAWVRATAGSLSDSAQVSVADSQVIVGLLTRTAAIAVGGYDTLVVEAQDCRGAPRPVTGLAFTPSASGIATVSPVGVIHGIAVGQLWVRATWAGRQDSADVAVVTHPAGTLGAPTPVPGSPFGIAVARSGVVLTALLNGGAVAELPVGGGSYTSFAAGLYPTDVGTSQDGLTGLVANQGDHGLGRLDLSPGSQLGFLPVGFDPFRILRSRDGLRYYVGGNGITVLALDAATGATVTSFTVDKDQNGLAESPDRTRLYVSSLFTGMVREITLSTGVVGRTFDVGGLPQEVVVSADGSELFVADEVGSYVGVWNFASGNKVDSILVGAGTFGMTLSPDGARLYASASAHGMLYLIDPGVRTVLDSLPVGGTPRRIAFNREGTTAYVANEAGWVDVIH